MFLVHKIEFAKWDNSQGINQELSAEEPVVESNSSGEERGMSLSTRYGVFGLQTEAINRDV